MHVDIDDASEIFLHIFLWIRFISQEVGCEVLSSYT